MLSNDNLVVIDYNDLCKEIPLSKQIEQAFGDNHEALGLILIQNVPGLREARLQLLSQANDLVRLPKNQLDQMESPISRYMFGWSHGKEFVNGKLDTSKGSFYANPMMDRPTTDPKDQLNYPEYCLENIWPETLPKFRPAFQQLGQLMVKTASLVAKHCDQFLLNKIPNYQPNFLFDMVTKSRAIKARLLHYYPNQESKELDNWCGWHLDHSALTVLTSAMFFNEETEPPTELLNVDEDAGLYIRNRKGDIVKVNIPQDCLAIQTGEALEVASSDQLKATPHCVKGVKDSTTISRNTLAVFIQPDWEQEVKPGVSFSSFTKKVLDRHY